MEVASMSTDTQRYARCIAASRRIRWDIDQDVIRQRKFDLAHKFLPDGLSLVNELPFLSAAEQRFLSQVQGRTYANMFRLVERFVGAKVLDISRDHWFGDQVALEALVRFTDEELKHQELFRRVELLAAEGMPEGYRFVPDANEVAGFVLGKHTWAVLALTCHIELVSQAHYRASIGTSPNLSDLFKDIFMFHWREESQHAILDELEWAREDARLSDEERTAGVADMIQIVGALDAILQQQAAADTAYFMGAIRGRHDAPHAAEVEHIVLKAYRWTYFVSGMLEPRFVKLLESMTSEAQRASIDAAMAPLLYAMPAAGAPVPAMAA
ncbi:hypothetical protein CUPL110328_16560 [Cupriavidus plantarum]|nr:hypothetical protein [Cupriavidus plantarum]RLK33755.1 hypothetical protein C7417_4405 [Cupriavidus plantarum]CAG2147809.1 hypothetical protein LMG26296_04200 [Cupriavidus plantarum]SMR85473.1 hypothetical protein SAMN05421735_4276 [Cupriavidus plantarum]